MLTGLEVRARTRQRLAAVRELYKSSGAEQLPEARGRRLLREWLSPEQREQFERCQYFDVIGSDTGNRYRIYYGTSANVREIDGKGRSTRGWCFTPSGRLAPGDVMLAQKIALETDERGALSVANRF